MEVEALFVVVVDRLLPVFAGLVAGDAGDGGGVVVQGHFFEVAGAVVDVAFFEPVGVAAPDVEAFAEAVGEGGPAVSGEAAEGAAGGEFFGAVASEGEAFEEVVVGVDLRNLRPRREAGGETEGSPVAPLAIDVVRVDAGGLVEFEEGDVGAEIGGEGLEFGEEGVAGVHGGPRRSGWWLVASG